MSYIGNPPVVNTARLVQEVTATQGQTTFYPAGGYTVGQLDVEVNGISLPSGDYTATDGVSVVLAKACGLNDVVRFVAFGTFNVANTYTQAQVDAKIGTVTQGFRNRIINGDMRIDQRNAGASVTVPAGGSAYVMDRWNIVRFNDTTGTFTCARSSVAPAGFASSALMTVTAAQASVPSNAVYRFAQSIEGFNVADLGWGTAAAQSITLGFWVRSSVTGTYGGRLRNSANTRSYVFQYTVNSANTFEFKTITIPGDTTGTWLTDNGIGITIEYGLGDGSGFQGTASAWQAGEFTCSSGNVRLINTNGATFYITGVQLEAGTVATPFERRPYGTEFFLCQRYRESVEVVHANSPSTQYATGYYKVAKRASPTITTSQITGSGMPTIANASSGQTSFYQSTAPAAVGTMLVTGDCEL